MADQIQVNGGDPAVQGAQGGKEGQFEGRGLSPNPGIQKQSGSGVPDLSAPQGSRRVERASRFLGSLGVLDRLKTLTTWILNQLVAFGLVNELTTSNFLIRLLVAVKYNLDRSDVALLQILVKKGKISSLDQSHFEKEEKETFERTKHSYGIFKDGIKKAFFGKTSGIKLWDTIPVSSRLSTMTLGEARGIWQTMANGVAVDCFAGDGHVDVTKLQTWTEFLGNAETFREEPFCFIPHVESMCSQMHRVCQCLLDDRNGAREQLNAVAGIAVGLHGQSILDAMSRDGQLQLTPPVAILASLFAPLGQLDLPTCTINSIINAEIQNHPERLIPMYIQILSNGDGDQITFPSGYEIQQQSVKDGSIIADFGKGGEGRDRVFEKIRGNDPTKAAQQIKRWQEEGVGYKPSTDEAEKYKLEMSVHNINDALLTHLLLASNFGNKEIDDSRNWGAMAVYAGLLENDEIFSDTIPVGGSNFLYGIAKLKTQAEDQRQHGHDCMRVVIDGSLENIDIPALLALDPNTMEIGRAYPFGNFSYAGLVRNTPLLAVRKVMPRRWFGASLMLRLTGGKVDDIPTFEFGILRGSTFKKENITAIELYSTEIKKLNLQDLKPFEELDHFPQPFAEGIRKAFSSETDDIGDMSLASARARLSAMTLGEARRVWQTITNGVAADCFDANDHVDVAKLQTWMTFLENAETFKKKPLCLIPHIELMRSQMHRVCQCLLDDQTGAMAQLNAVAGIAVGPYGQSILDAMSRDGQQLTPPMAILASLLTPHRQKSLLTCTINSIINEELQNHPERLIPMYAQMLRDAQFTFPSGHAIQQQQIENQQQQAVSCSITINLKNGGEGRNALFDKIMNGNRTEIDAQIAVWGKEEVGYVESTDPAEKYKLRLPVHDMNDVLFAYFFQASNFGNRKMGDDDEFGTMLIYTGHRKLGKLYSATILMSKSKILLGRFVTIMTGILASATFLAMSTTPIVSMTSIVSICIMVLYIICVMELCIICEIFFAFETQMDSSKIPDGIAKLKEQAEAQRKLGHFYMRVVTDFFDNKHAWNIDIDALSALDPDTMEPGKGYSFGDLNWSGENMSWGIPRLAVRKMYGTPPTYEFGTLEGSQFKKEDIFQFRVYRTDVRGRDAAFWDKFRP